MKKFNPALIVYCFIACSCASGYKLIHPETLSYIGKSESSDILFEYKYRVLADSGNKKYSKKENKKDVKLVAVKVTNNSDQPLPFGKIVNIYANGNLVEVLDSNQVKRKLKQTTPIYLLY